MFSQPFSVPTKKLFENKVHIFETQRGVAMSCRFDVTTL